MLVVFTLTILSELRPAAVVMVSIIFSYPAHMKRDEFMTLTMSSAVIFIFSACSAGCRSI